MDRNVEYKKLHKYDSYVILDTTPGSPEYFGLVTIPDSLFIGKNILKIQSNSKNMYVDTKIDLEILDSLGEPVYYEILDRLEDDKSRVISVHITEETPPGQCMFTFLGYAKFNTDGRRLSLTTGIPNIKHTFKRNIDISKDNESDIIFETPPDVTVTEKLVTFLGIESQSIVTGSSGSVNYTSTNEKSLLGVDGFRFIRDMSGSLIRVSNPVNATPPAPFTPDSNVFEARIKNIIRPDLVELDKFYKVTGSINKTHIYKSFESSSYELFYTSGSKKNTPKKKSYAQVSLKKLEPKTGEVSKIKTYVKSAGQTTSDYTLVSETDVKPSELLIDYNNNVLENKIGVFTSQSVFNNNYTIESQSLSTTMSVTESNETLQNSISLTPHSSSEYYMIKLKPENYISLLSNTEYIVTFDAFSRQISGSANMDLYGVGNAFKYTNEFGKKIISINNVETVKRYEELKYTFKPENNGLGTIGFNILSGTWDISNISIKAKHSKGYTPNHSIMNIPIPTQIRNDKLEFKFEFATKNGNTSTTEVTTQETEFVGENVYMTNNDNVLSGQLSVSGVSGSGLIIENPCTASEAGIMKSPMFSSFDEVVVEETKNIGGMFMLSTSGSSLSGCDNSSLTASNYSENVSVDFITDDALGFFKFRAHGDNKELVVRETNGFKPINTFTDCTFANTTLPLRVGSFITQRNKYDDYIVSVGSWVISSGSVSPETGTFFLTSNILTTSSFSPTFIPMTDYLQFGDGFNSGSNSQYLVAVTHSLEQIPTESMCRFDYFIVKNEDSGSQNAIMNNTIFYMCTKQQARQLQQQYPVNLNI
jgi:hypothetical protein